jgi:outer membrane protein
MKKTFVAGLLVALAAAGTTALAQEAKSPRIAVVDLQRVSAESALGKGYAAQLEKLQNEYTSTATAKQTELGKLDAALKTLTDELEKQGSVLSAEARDKKQQEIVRKQRERQAFLEDGQAELRRMQERMQQQNQTISNEFQVKVRPLIEQVAKARGADIVLFADGGGVLLLTKDFDITPDVIAKADVPAAPAAAAPAAPPATPKP